MSKLKRPLRLWHGLLAIVAALAVGAAGTAIAGGGKGKDLTTAGIPPRGVFLDSGKYHYGVKIRASDPGRQPAKRQAEVPARHEGDRRRRRGDSTDPTEQFLNYSAPFDSRDRGRVPEDGWIVFVNNNGTEGEVVVVEAICRDKGS